ncbi:hypothetical protein BS47DRAFT_207491 [Hydnum rufescens UP504]|uniref:DUF6534 domain-containing protein n=1 Tax=Hydnum rufescens UP504 TaxID=1448309 RepID=A0A9P6AMX0_9AGAM|nr:hypothetical protein BS47DRAFT_207491 [Hydnum rufescens UP504]
MLLPPSYIGTLLLGAILGSYLFGITTVQLFLYNSRFPKDLGVLKVLVVSPWLLQGVQIGFITASMYFYVTKHDSPLWLSVPYELTGVLVSALVQIFYTQRIRQLTDNIYITFILGTLIVSKLVNGTLVATALYFPMYFRKPLDAIAKAWMASDVSLDILIVLFLSLGLYRHRTGFQRTDVIINRLAWYALHTGLVTSTLCLANLIVYSVKGITASNNTLSIVTGGLYVVAMLANLHTRTRLGKMFRPDHSNAINLPTLVRGNRSTPSASGSNQDGSLPVSVGWERDVT